MRLDERDMSTDMLLMEKQLAISYLIAENESANIHLRRLLHECHEESEKQRARIFHGMHQRGWYKTPVAGQQAIESAVINWEQKLVKQPELRT